MEISNDKILIKEIKRYKCSPCISELRNRHIGLVLSVYSKYSNILNQFNFTNEDFNKEIDYLIFDSARKFDLRRKNIKFSTWLGENIRFFCLNKITEFNKNKYVNSDPDNITKLIDECLSHADNSVENKEDCDYLFSLLEQIKDPRVMKIFTLRYFSGIKNKMTWKEIGALIVPPITNQTCINIHKKTIKFLKEKLSSKISQDKI